VKAEATGDIPVEWEPPSKMPGCFGCVWLVTSARGGEQVYQMMCIQKILEIPYPRRKEAYMSIDRVS
jgi:hypothetical protein